MASLLAVATALVVLVTIVINEDPPQARSVPALVLVVLSCLAVPVAWRWERPGGAVLVGIGAFTGATAAALTLNNATIAAIAFAIYGGPFVIAGLLFALTAHTADR